MIIFIFSKLPSIYQCKILDKYYIWVFGNCDNRFEAKQHCQNSYKMLVYEPPRRTGSNFRAKLKDSTLQLMRLPTKSK